MFLNKILLILIFLPLFSFLFAIFFGRKFGRLGVHFFLPAMLGLSLGGSFYLFREVFILYNCFFIDGGL
jgi:hypothetical protein